MRNAVLALVVGTFSLPAFSQDPAAMAAMQASQQASMMATQAAQQANDQAMQASQQASQQAMQAAQQAGIDNGPNFVSTPKFSVKPGMYKDSQTVYITDRTRNAVIYYTTNGWTPTSQSPRYTAPITVDSTTHLQAIAIAPGWLRSMVADATYTLPAPAAPPAPIVAGPNGLLRQGTEVALTFTTDLTSRTAKIGDPIDLTLASTIQVGNHTIAPGAHAAGVVIDVRRPGVGGVPGSLTFAVRSLSADGVTIPLTGTETEEGESRIPHGGIFLIPVVGVTKALATRGGQAEIHSDMPVVATIAADTTLSAR